MAIVLIDLAVGLFAFQAVALLIGLVVLWQVEGLCRRRQASLPHATA